MKHSPSLECLAPDVSEPSLALYVSLVFILERWWKPRSTSKVVVFRMKVRLDRDVLYRLVQMQITGLVESAKKAPAKRSFGAEFPNVVVHVTARHFGVGAQHTL